MKTLQILIVLLPLWVCSAQPARSQVSSGSTKHLFAESIQKVKVWTYIGGDTTFRSYSEAINTILEALAEKGYQTSEVFYPKKPGEDPVAWRNRIINSLDSGTALIRVVTTLVYDCTRVTSTSNTQVTVVDPSGGTSSQYHFPEMVERGYMFDISCDIYTNPLSGISGSTYPIHTDSSRVIPAELEKGIRLIMSWIPRCRNSISTPVILPENQPVVAEFTAFGGYAFGSSMEITGGSVTFDPNASYGLDIGIGILPGLYITAGYRREDTHMNVSSTRSVREDSPVGVNFNYVLFGAQYQLEAGSHFSFFAGGSLGGVNIFYPDKFYRDIWYLCVGVQTGVKLFVSRYAGFRIQGGLLYQVHPEGAPFLYSSQPSYFPLNANSNMIQWGLDAGFILRLGYRK